MLIQVKNNIMYWNWLQQVFIPGVFSGRWYNGQEEKQTMYIGNKHSILVGMARIRQFRVKSSKFLFVYLFIYFLHLTDKAIYTHTLFPLYSHTNITDSDSEIIVSNPSAFHHSYG